MEGKLTKKGPTSKWIGKQIPKKGTITEKGFQLRLVFQAPPLIESRQESAKEWSGTRVYPSGPRLLRMLLVLFRPPATAFGLLNKTNNLFFIFERQLNELL